MGSRDEVLNYIGVFYDITLKKQTEEMLIDMATHDLLTGLPNRRNFEEHLSKAIRRAGHDHERMAVLFLDLDRFKPINDMFGHDAGDMVLVEIARRINGALRPSDLAARYGGDEFIICMETSSERVSAINISERILASISRPIRLGEHHVSVGASIGIAFFPDDGSTPEELLTAADSAMYRAKNEGGYGFATRQRGSR
jgi:diguanylate cyclase (GGDEF)-like protein